MKNKLKKWFIVVLTVFYMAFVFPTAVVRAESNDVKQEVDAGEETSSEETTTIEDEPTAEAAVAQNQMTLITQMSIIGLGILMAGAGTYVFCIKNKSGE